LAGTFPAIFRTVLEFVARPLSGQIGAREYSSTAPMQILLTGLIPIKVAKSMIGWRLSAEIGY
jgi:hypothetical protein